MSPSKCFDGSENVADRSTSSTPSVTGQNWPKVGVEIELLAPRGRSRKDLAVAIAADSDGQAHQIFYAQSEYSRLDEAPVFENLTLGFDARARDGTLLARCVDDLTLVKDLDRDRGPQPNWYRILSDDKRFLNLIQECCDPAESLQNVLTPLARLFNVDPEAPSDGEYVKISDKHGESVAMCVPLPGERHRPCELITPPLTTDRDKVLQRFLALASELNFTVPVEAATHIHFDGATLQSAQCFANVIAVFGKYRTSLRTLVGTNMDCTRLGDWPKKVYRTGTSADFAKLQWTEAADQLRQTGPSKFCDFNFINLLGTDPDKQTFEVRILPGTMDAALISKSIRLFEAMLLACVNDRIGMRTKLPKFDTFLAELGLNSDDHAYWSDRKSNQTIRQRFEF